jgi:antitoxin ParD1/3/4
MSNVEKISIALTPDLALVVQQAVESGGYASTSEVIREALRDWKAKRLLREQQIEEIRNLWREGINSGTGRFGDVNSIIREAQRRFEAENKIVEG